MLLEHVDDMKESFRFSEHVVGQERMDNAFDFASIDQVAGGLFEIPQRLDGYAVLVQELIEQRDGLRLRPHGFQVLGLEKQLIEVLAELACLLDQLPFGRIQ